MTPSKLVEAAELRLRLQALNDEMDSIRDDFAKHDDRDGSGYTTATGLLLRRKGCPSIFAISTY